MSFIEQNSIAGRDSIQIGRDQVQKLFDAIFNLNISNQNFSQLNILNPDNSEIKSYLSFWEKLDSGQKVSLVLNCRQYIKETYTKKIVKGASNHFPSKGLVDALFILFFLLVQYRPYREFLLETEYTVFSSATSVYCNISKDMLIPLPTCTLPVKTVKPSELVALSKKDFESYKKSWFEFAVSCIAIPWLAAKILLNVIGFPLNAIHNSKLEREKKTLEKEKRAKEQTYNVLFNLLNDSEQSQVKELEKALQLVGIRARVSSLAKVLTVMYPIILDESNMENLAKLARFSDIFFPTLDEKSKEELIACLFPNLDRESIIKALKGYPLNGEEKYFSNKKMR
jgi:hypothetical protein